MPPRYKITALPGIPFQEVAAQVSAGKVKPAGIHFLKGFLEYFEEALLDGIEMRPDEVQHYAFAVLGYDRTRPGAYHRMTLIRNTYHLFYEDGPFLRSMSAGIASIWREYQSPKPKSEWKQKRSRMAVPKNQLPQGWQEALENMSRGFDGVDRAAPSVGFIVSIGQRVRELTRVCSDAGLQPKLDVVCITAYERSLLVREEPLRPATIRSSLAQIRDMARYLGSDNEVIEHLDARVSYHERKAGKVTPIKETKVLKIPSYTEVFEKAFDLLGKSDTTKRLQQAQQFRNVAAALALLVPFPLRLADTRLHFGTHLKWTGQTWRIEIEETSKTGVPFRATLLPFFRVFVDKLVLQGAAEDYLDELREKAVKDRRALFETHLGEHVSDAYVSKAWSFAYGTGSHIARTKLHDEFAVFGLKGVEAALVACGHRSARSAEHYRTRAFRLLAGDHIRMTSAASISDKEWEAYFGNIK